MAWIVESVYSIPVKNAIRIFLLLAGLTILYPAAVQAKESAIT